MFSDAHVNSEDDKIVESASCSVNILLFSWSFLTFKIKYTLTVLCAYFQSILSFERLKVAPLYVEL